MKRHILTFVFTALFAVVVTAQFTSAMAFNAPAAVAADSSAAAAAAAAHQQQRQSSSLSSVTGEVTGYVYRNNQKMPAKDVRPGETILWELKIQNNSGRAISGIKYDADIPSGTVFVQNSESAAAEYSLDNRNFSRSPQVRDANGNPVAAPVSSFVAIRFTVSLNAGETKIFTYQTTVK